MMRQCNLVEFFSGIGSQAKALKNLEIKVNTLGTSEWDVHAIAAYDLIHNTAEIPEEILDMGKEALLEKLKGYTFSNSGKVALDYSSLRTYSREALQRIYASVVRNKNFVDISAVSGSVMPDNIDILTYSFPCQDLSNVGAFHGYNKGIDKDSGSRSSLLWQVGRILTEMKTAEKRLPKFLLMENVPTLLSKRHFGNFSTWIEDLQKLGYISKYFPLNASSFGLPQNRPRLLMISVYVGEDDQLREIVQTYLDGKESADVVSDYRSSPYFHEYSVQDLLRLNYENKKIRQEAEECTPNDTVSRQKIWEDNPQIILPGNVFNSAIETVRTITTKQDRNPNSGNLYFDSGIEGRSKFRYLTPRECLLFMGFTDEDFKQLKKNNVEFHKGDALFARDKVIRMAGNSIPVKLLEGVFWQILKIDDLINEYIGHTVELQQAAVETTDYSSVIRSYLFSKGIRSRIGKEYHPAKADIVYPKYKTAIYIKRCFEDNHDCKHGEKSESTAWVWRILSEKHDAVAADMASSKGWQVLVVWECELQGHKCKRTLKWIERRIRANRYSEQEE